MSSKPDTVAPEQLTDEERAEAEGFASDDGPQDNGEYLAGKLLRIHDRLQARVRESERRLVAMQRQCAAAFIEEYQDQLCGNTEPWDCTLDQALTRADPGVAALVHAHLTEQVGTCDRCGEVAPLQPVGVPHGAERLACSWGCRLKAPS